MCVHIYFTLYSLIRTIVLFNFSFVLTESEREREWQIFNNFRPFAQRERERETDRQTDRQDGKSLIISDHLPNLMKLTILICTQNARARTHARTHTHTHTRTHARTHAHTHARTHTRTHTHTHTHTHTQRSFLHFKIPSTA